MTDNIIEHQNTFTDSGYLDVVNPSSDYGERTPEDRAAMAEAVQAAPGETPEPPKPERPIQSSLFDEGVSAAVREAAVRVVDPRADAIASARAIGERSRATHAPLTHAEKLREGVISRRQQANRRLDVEPIET
jgi:hypothetical protein